MNFEYVVKNVCGIVDCSVSVREGVSLFYGVNESGKTSFANAVRCAHMGYVPSGLMNIKGGPSSSEYRGEKGLFVGSVAKQLSLVDDFLMSEELPSMEELYYMFCESPLSAIDIGGKLGLKSIFELAEMDKAITVGKKKQAAPPPKYSLEEARDRLIDSFLSGVSFYLNMCGVDPDVAKKVSGGTITFEDEGKCIEGFSSRVNEVILAASYKGKAEKEAEVQLDFERSKLALEAYLRVEDGARKTKFIDGKQLVGTNGVPFKLMSRGKKHSRVVEMKLYAAKKHGAAVPMIIDDFEQVTGNVANKMIVDIHKQFRSACVPALIFIARPVTDVCEKAGVVPALNKIGISVFSVSNSLITEVK